MSDAADPQKPHDATPKLPDVESPPRDDVLDSVPSKDEVVEQAESVDEVIKGQPSVDEILGRDRHDGRPPREVA